MQLQDAISQASVFQLWRLSSKAEVQVGFLGSRRIVIQGYGGSASLDALSKRVSELHKVPTITSKLFQCLGIFLSMSAPWNRHEEFSFVWGYLKKALKNPLRTNKDRFAVLGKIFSCLKYILFDKRVFGSSLLNRLEILERKSDTEVAKRNFLTRSFAYLRSPTKPPKFPSFWQ